jgi:hypothetical protein
MPEVQIHLWHPRMQGLQGTSSLPEMQKEASMMQFYQEHNGDYLAIDTATNAYYRQTFGKDHFEGRATALQGLVSSVCTTGISRQFLRECCKKIARKNVPTEWIKAIGL